MRFHYKKFPETIRIFGDKKSNKMIASGSWVKRDETCKQKIIPFFEQPSETNIGFVLERMIVLDLDRHDSQRDGMHRFNEWIKEQTEEKQQQIKEDIKNTLTVVTPKKGLHIHFLVPAKYENMVGKQRNQFMEGVDILTGANQFTPAPISQRADGKYLLSENSSEYINEAPEWLMELYFSDMKQEEKAMHYKNRLYRNGAYYTKDYEVKSAMNIIVTEMFEGYGAGERHSRLVKQAGRIIGVVRARKLTKLNGSRILYVTAQNCSPPYDQDETARIWRSLMKNEM